MQIRRRFSRETIFLPIHWGSHFLVLFVFVYEFNILFDSDETQSAMADASLWMLRRGYKPGSAKSVRLKTSSGILFTHALCGHRIFPDTTSATTIGCLCAVWCLSTIWHLSIVHEKLEKMVSLRTQYP